MNQKEIRECGTEGHDFVQFVNDGQEFMDGYVCTRCDKVIWEDST